MCLHVLSVMSALVYQMGLQKNAALATAGSARRMMRREKSILSQCACESWSHTVLFADKRDTRL